MSRSFKKTARLLRIARFGFAVLVTLVIVLHVLGEIRLPMVDRLDHLLYDLRTQVTLSGKQDDRLVIVAIDEKSLAKEGRWPWSREKLSFLVDILFDYYDVKLLGFDVFFSERDESINIDVAEKLVQRIIISKVPRDQVMTSLRSELANDERFARSLRDRPVVLGYAFSGKKEDKSPGVLPAPVASVEEILFADQLQQMESYSGNLKKLQVAARQGGFINYFDGVLRQVPLLIRYRDGVYGSLALSVVAELFEERPKFGLASYGEGSNVRLESISVGGLAAPVDQNSAVLVPFRSRHENFTYVSAVDVLNGTEKPSALKGKIVLIGATAAGLSDRHPTPIHNKTPGVEIHANIISGFLDQSFKSRPAYLKGWEFLQVLVIGLIAVLFAHRLSLWGMTLLFFSLFATVTAGNFMLWVSPGFASNLAPPLLLLVFLYGLQLFFGFFLETRRKQQLSNLFGQYVPPELVEEMSRSEEDYSVGGMSRELSVLFSDIRDFTAISESLEPGPLCDLINEIFTAMTQEIQQTKGTIDKYMGDALMAFWGAPLPNEKHAGHAVAAALAMVRIITKLNEGYSAAEKREIHIGVGVNTGIMNVGNMGSEFRMAYTVMGDAVNLSSRLEGLTKYYGADIIVSEFTAVAAPQYLYRELDQVRVKGKKEPITIYEPLCLLEQADSQLLDEVELARAALQDYRASRWDEAESSFAILLKQRPDDHLYSIFIKRINEFRKNPPQDRWDGVYSFTSK